MTHGPTTDERADAAPDGRARAAPEGRIRLTPVADEITSPSDRPAAPGGQPPPTGTVRYRVRRSPNVWAFLVTGAFLGALVGFSVDYFGPDGCAKVQGVGCTAPYSPGASLAYFLVLGALAGVAVAATLAVALDKFFSTR